MIPARLFCDIFLLTNNFTCNHFTPDGTGRVASLRHTVTCPSSARRKVSWSVWVRCANKHFLWFAALMTDSWMSFADLVGLWSPSLVGEEHQSSLTSVSPVALVPSPVCLPSPCQVDSGVRPAVMWRGGLWSSQVDLTMLHPAAHRERYRGGSSASNSDAVLAGPPVVKNKSPPPAGYACRSCRVTAPGQGSNFKKHWFIWEISVLVNPHSAETSSVVLTLAVHWMSGAVCRSCRIWQRVPDVSAPTTTIRTCSMVLPLLVRGPLAAMRRITSRILSSMLAQVLRLRPFGHQFLVWSAETKTVVGTLRHIETCARKAAKRSTSHHIMRFHANPSLLVKFLHVLLRMGVDTPLAKTSPCVRPPIFGQKTRVRGQRGTNSSFLHSFEANACVTTRSSLVRAKTSIHKASRVFQRFPRLLHVSYRIPPSFGLSMRCFAFSNGGVRTVSNSFFCKCTASTEERSVHCQHSHLIAQKRIDKFVGIFDGTVSVVHAIVPFKLWCVTQVVQRARSASKIGCA